MKLSVVIPCYNEGGSVVPLYEECLRVFGSRRIDFELIYVNDGSSDDTLARLRQVAARGDARVKIVDFSRNFGKEAAIFAGLRQAEAEYTALMDGDMQQPPEVVADMAAMLDKNENIDCVAAVQKVRRENIAMTTMKRWFYKIINSLSSVDFVNGASDFRVFRKNMREAILSMSEYFRFSKGIFSYVGFPTEYIEYKVRDRAAGQSKFGFKNSMKYAIEGIVGYSTKPLKIMTLIGGFLSIASFVYLIVVVIQKLFFSIDVPGYPTIVVLILLTGGIQMLGLGIIGEYLGKDYIETKNRPVYIAREIIDNGDSQDAGR